MAAAGGHANIVKILLENGANAEDENAVCIAQLDLDGNWIKCASNLTDNNNFQHGMTALHLGAKNGFVSILEAFDKSLWRRCSRKVGSHARFPSNLLCSVEKWLQTGLNALHIAAYYGNSDFVNEMLKSVPASIRSEPPIYNHHVVKEFATEVRLLLMTVSCQ